MALSPHARPQAVDEPSYSLKPDFWKGLEAIHMGRARCRYPLRAINRYRGNVAERDKVIVVVTTASEMSD
jgi:hypothetical protein